MSGTFPVKQSKFSNGEISPLLQGDVLHPKWPSSLRTCLNWVPIPQGPVVKRAGSFLTASVKNPLQCPRLVPFVFSDASAFMLEIGTTILGAGYVRFWQDPGVGSPGAYVGNDGALHVNGDSYVGGYYELAIPGLTTAMLPYLKWSQVGDVITFCAQAPGQPAMQPQDLRHTSLSLTPWTVTATPVKIPGGVIVPGTPGLGDGVSDFGSITYHQGDRVYWTDGTGNKGEFTAIQANVVGPGQKPPDPFTVNFSSSSVEGNLYWVPSSDQTHPAKKQTWGMTAVVQDSVGVTYESGVLFKFSLNTALSEDRPRPLTVQLPVLAAGYTLLYCKLYRATSGGVMGFVDNLYAGNLIAYPGNALGNYVDDGRAPDFSQPPPSGTDPFLVGGADSFPALIGYLDQRRAFMDSLVFPSTMLLSKAGDFYNWDNLNVPGSDKDAFNLLLVSESLEQIRSFVPLRRGLVLTAQGEWAIAGQGGGPVSRSSQDARRQSAWGSSWLRPIVIGTGIVFNTHKRAVRDLYPLYGLYADIWDGQELSTMVRHMMDDHDLINMVYQSTPYPVIWAVRDDGTMLTLTYQHAPPSFGQQLTEGVVAWAQHRTGLVNTDQPVFAGGSNQSQTDGYEEVCALSVPPYDTIFTVVRRFINGQVQRYIEKRFGTSVFTQASFARLGYSIHLDCSTMYNGTNIGLTTFTVDSATNPGSVNLADYAIGKQVNVTASANAFVAADAANPYGSSLVLDGVTKGRVVAYVGPTQVMIEMDSAMTASQVAAWRAGSTVWAIAKGQISAPQLAGVPLDSGMVAGSRGVFAQTDGDAQVPALVDGAGVVYLTTPAVVAVVGIAYNADAETLDAHTPTAEIRNRFKNVIRIGFEVAGTRGLWLGKDLNNLVPWKQRKVSDSYGSIPLFDGYDEVRALGEFGKTGRVSIRHWEPFPAVITSLTREMSLGDT